MQRLTHFALAAACVCLLIGVHAREGLSAQPAEFGEGSVFIATLTGAQENPQVTTNGIGYALFTFNQKTSTLCVALSFSGLSSDAIAAHVHGPADPDENAGVLIPLSITSPVNQCGTLDKNGRKALKAGRLYVNVHTPANQGGEIRGQILPIKGPHYKDPD